MVAVLFLIFIVPPKTQMGMHETGRVKTVDVENGKKEVLFTQLCSKSTLS